MRRIRVRATFGYPGAYHEEDFYFDDTATQAEIDEEVWEWAAQFVETTVVQEEYIPDDEA